MLVLVGRATRLQRYLVGLPKAYRTEARFGATSTTGDPTGELSATGRAADEAAVRAALADLTGEITQTVPAFSAVKVGGERLYRRARAGEEVDRPERTVRIDRLELLRFDESAQEAELVVECSSGTYVRQLVADLGELSGAGAHCITLERTRVGPFELADVDPQRMLSLVGGARLPPRARELPRRGRARQSRASSGGGSRRRGRSASRYEGRSSRSPSNATGSSARETVVA